MTRFWKYACNCNATDEEAEEVAWYIVDTRADEWRAARDVTFFAPPPRTHFRVQDPTELPNVTEVAPVDSPVSLPELWVTKEFYRAKLNGRKTKLVWNQTKPRPGKKYSRKGN